MENEWSKWSEWLKKSDITLDSIQLIERYKTNEDFLVIQVSRQIEP